MCNLWQNTRLIITSYNIIRFPEKHKSIEMGNFNFISAATLCGRTSALSEKGVRCNSFIFHTTRTMWVYLLYMAEKTLPSTLLCLVKNPITWRPTTGRNILLFMRYITAEHLIPGRCSIQCLQHLHPII